MAILLAGEVAALMVPISGSLPDTRRSASDAEKAEAIARQPASDELSLFMTFCAARAQRLVTANLPLVELLLPVALSRPILTGEEVEEVLTGRLAFP